MRVVLDEARIKRLELKKEAEGLSITIGSSLPEDLTTIDHIELTRKEHQLLETAGYTSYGKVRIVLYRGDERGLPTFTYENFRVLPDAESSG